jgi:hypothetical protein
MKSHAVGMGTALAIGARLGIASAQAPPSSSAGAAVGRYFTVVEDCTSAAKLRAVGK